jgi:hypothetical protein
MKKKIGVIGVDAGLCWLGDPCYVFGEDASHKWKTWMDFVNSIKEMEHPTTQQFNYEMGHAGLGVLVSTGYGDGCYPVYAEIEDNRVKSVTVKFFEDDEEESPE